MSGTSLPILRDTADTVTFYEPGTGEQIVLAEADTPTLAALRDLIRMHEDDQRVAKQQLDAELHRRMDLENTLTLHVGGWTITGKPAEATEWNTELLAVVLQELVEDGKLSEDAAKRALEPVLTLKPRAGELKKLADKFLEIRECAQKVPQPRRATVKWGNP